MGTTAFDAAWEGPSQSPGPKPDALDAIWNAPHVDAAAKLHAEFKSGALQKRMAGANARDAANVADEQGAEPGYLERAATHVLNTAQGIPGVEAVEAGAGALGSHLTDHPMGYGQSLDALRGNTSQIGGKTNVAEHVMGGLATVPFLPASAAKAGAVLGGADAALSADPDQSLAGRAGKTVLGAGLGAAVGKAGEMAVTAGRSLLTQNPAANLIQKQAERALSAKKLYGAALAEGRGRTATPAIQSFVAEPDIAEIVSELQQTRQFKDVEPHAPEMLDAIYKTLSDRAATIKKGLDAVSPTRPNIGRFRGQDINAAQGQLLGAMDTPPKLGPGAPLDLAEMYGTTPESEAMSIPIRGPMAGYKTAVADFAQRTREMDALKKGYDVLRIKTTGTLPTGRNLTRLTPEAFGKAAGSMDPAEQQAASEGVLGASRMSLLSKPLTQGRKAVSEAPALLRSTGTAQQRVFDQLLKAGLITANGSTQ